jgi:hypothetical protein
VTQLIAAGPGDVLAVWSSGDWDVDLIRAGEALQGEPAVADHVAIITHQDPAGRWIGIQGEPGGVGLVDCTPWLASTLTRSNHDQPKPGDHGQMATFLASCALSLGLRYDWAGIGMDAADMLHLHDLTDLINKLYRWDAPHGKLPGEVVCSSLAWWQYDNVGWAHPDPAQSQGRICDPATWWQWSDQRLWVNQ